MQGNKMALEANKQFEMAKRLAVLMDSKFEVWGFKFGLDPIIDVIPGIGGTITMLVSFYIILTAARFNLSRWDR